MNYSLPRLNVADRKRGSQRVRRPVFEGDLFPPDAEEDAVSSEAELPSVLSKDRGDNYAAHMEEEPIISVESD